MAKVKTERRTFNGAGFQFDYHCDSDGEFSCQLPPQVHQLLGVSRVVGRTLSEVENNVKKTIAEYDAATTTKRKVICYKFQASCRIKDSDGRLVLELKEVSFSSGCALSLGAAVYTEDHVARRGQHDQYNYKKEQSTIPVSLSDRIDVRSWLSEPHANLLEWTPEREEFFRQMGLALEKLILKLHELTGDNEGLAQIAQTGNVKLLS